MIDHSTPDIFADHHFNQNSIIVQLSALFLERKPTFSSAYMVEDNFIFYVKSFNTFRLRYQRLIPQNCLKLITRIVLIELF